MTVPALSKAECQAAKYALAARVAYMMGRKLEEADWSHVYCSARGLQIPDWSNLHADVMIPGLALEHKMMRCSESQAIRDHCGTTMMHPALTRRVSLPDTADPAEAMKAVIEGYQRVLDERRAKVAAISAGRPVELRSGWLLYESSLTEFLYFEEFTSNINPTEHRAVWKERERRGESGRRNNKNLWIYDVRTGRKVWSVTGGSSGTKIQPYFDVPPADDPNLCYFRVQGEPLNAEVVRVWLTEPTARTLRGIIGSLDTQHVSDKILNVECSPGGGVMCRTAEPVEELCITREAYTALHLKFEGVSDEHRFQLLCKTLVS